MKNVKTVSYSKRRGEEGEEDEDLLKIFETSSFIIENFKEKLDDLIPENHNKIINILDLDIYSTIYKIQIQHDISYVIANNEQMALEILVGNWIDNKSTGLLTTREELDNEDEDNDYYVYVDASEYCDYEKSENWCFYIDPAYLNISEIKNLYNDM